MKEYRIFHIIMIVISVYISMLITNWGSPDFDEKDMFKLY